MSVIGIDIWYFIYSSCKVYTIDAILYGYFDNIFIKLGLYIYLYIDANNCSITFQKIT